MANPTNRTPRRPAAAIATHAIWLITSTAVIAWMVGPPPALAASQAAPVLADERPLAEHELAELRGGFFTRDGLEISFGFKVDVDLDDRYAMSMVFDSPFDDRHGKSGKQSAKHWSPKKPKGPKLLPGQVKLTLKDKTGGARPVAELGLRDDGTVAVLSGAPQITKIDGGTRYTFADGMIADVVEAADGITVATKTPGDLPVKVMRTSDAFDLEVGDEGDDTRIIDRISPSLVLSQLVNRRDGADLGHRVDFDINVLNFSELTANQRSHQNGRKMQRLVDRGLVRMLTPR